MVRVPSSWTVHRGLWATSNAAEPAVDRAARVLGEIIPAEEGQPDPGQLVRRHTVGVDYFTVCRGPCFLYSALSMRSRNARLSISLTPASAIFG
ncbi:Uncharacterised protein [Mycolicibacterium thermoresistibile]|jgi:hypothetical protein|uniref:Uncharacterized protein n=1 Tax=Mycolicibacterium thermoresistibile TaxID=1797 RepID=A0A100XHN1_MYCTH|nr:putative uncharacterized protein [Mycolicibacterium thermoresistibile]SNW17676.1 Uncharacterised protein [Mycolicibacterium thermoresistibile]